jgi:hypothetical protein
MRQMSYLQQLTHTQAFRCLLEQGAHIYVDRVCHCAKLFTAGTVIATLLTQ